MSTWPKRGRCGACARPAQQFPSGRWAHDGRPCKARSQSLWRVDDLVDLRAMLVFVPDGEELPQPPARRWQMLLGPGPGIPATIGLVPPREVANAWDRVRAGLAAEAEQAVAS